MSDDECRHVRSAPQPDNEAEQTRQALTCGHRTGRNARHRGGDHPDIDARDCPAFTLGARQAGGRHGGDAGNGGQGATLQQADGNDDGRM
ncbi:MAG: hypothetical protein M1449_13885 [Candidatus Thermoplasmatota archaeon]|nr:hypothetical protein [Candidatus Thermoplasmatota archaeon]